MPANDGGEADNEMTWSPVEMLDQKQFKKSIIWYGMHSNLVKHMLNNETMKYKLIPQDWKGLVSAVLEAGQQLKSLLW